jgi:hypothetical protein
MNQQFTQLLNNIESKNVQEDTLRDLIKLIQSDPQYATYIEQHSKKSVVTLIALIQHKDEVSIELCVWIY